ncbi:hypothetical protein ABW19_dt0202731 [Dactylella cylindrospora]|nr:hypothetical protein ABW19_dt0202731 [Dactylella cylindrospora]
MAAFPTITLVISILNLVGSLSSCIGSGLIVVCYLILPIKRHFRHSLIFNLAIADFLNSTNNSTSGLWKLIKQKDLPRSPGCIANGYFSQLTVQATDCSILAIAIVTVYALTRKTQISENLPRLTTIIICGSTWILPLITSFTALGLGRYGPVSGNWCWIVPQPAYFRYVMTHGWRFAFILSEIIMYTYLHFYVRRRFGALLEASRNGSQSGTAPVQPGPAVGATAPPHPGSNLPAPPSNQYDLEVGYPQNQTFGQTRSETWLSDNYSKGSMRDSPTPTTPVPPPPPPKKSRFKNPFSHRRAELKEEKKKDPNAARSSRVRKILLLNAYPAAYIILWIPGIVNRLVEASGGSSRVLQVLQASTQFVGLANAITYGWNERVGQQLRDYFSERWGRGKRASVEEIGSGGRIEMGDRMRIRMQGSKEKLREIREGLREGLRRDGDVDEDHGHLVYSNGKWEWSRSTSINEQDANEGPSSPRRE